MLGVHGPISPDKLGSPWPTRSLYVNPWPAQAAHRLIPTPGFTSADQVIQNKRRRVSEACERKGPCLKQPGTSEHLPLPRKYVVGGLLSLRVAIAVAAGLRQAGMGWVTRRGQVARESM